MARTNASDSPCQQLIATVKLCLNRDDSDQTVAQTILSSLKENSSVGHDMTAQRRVTIEQNLSKPKGGKGKGNTKEPQGAWATSHATALNGLVPAIDLVGKIPKCILPQCDMIEICSYEEFQQFATLRQAFQDSAPVTTLLVGNAWCLERSNQTCRHEAENQLSHDPNKGRR